MNRDLGEFELIERLQRRLGGGTPSAVGIGDDAAVIEGSPTRVVSVDATVDGVHFDSGTWPAPAIAWKSIAAAVSDLAAMAADPVEVYLSLGIPAGVGEALLEGLIDGTEAVTGHLGVAVAGGDTVGSPVLFLAVTAIGELPDGTGAVLRSGASSGNLVAVTGELGGARAGLALVGEEGVGQSGGSERTLIERLLHPEPRLVFSEGLREAGVTALIDVSDGLVADLGHIAALSGVGIELDVGQVPVQEGVDQVAERFGASGLDFALAGGEDYELALTFPPSSGDQLAELADRVGLGLTVVGTVVEGSGVELLLEGRPYAIGGGEGSPGGFEHRF